MAEALPHREPFPTGKRLVGRLHSVRRRPIENRDQQIVLLRLVFEFFQKDELKRELRSLGKIASRDVVISPSAAQDFGVAPFTQALRVRSAHEPDAWLALAATRPWVEVVFGPSDDADVRNRFQEIWAFDVTDYTIVENPWPLGQHWVTSRIAAEEFGCSVATIHRRLVELHTLQSKWGQLLEQRTSGGHRRINLILLRHLWSLVD